MNRGRVIHLATSDNRGVPKIAVNRIELLPNWGVKGDAHAGEWDRQVSLLEVERLEELEKKGIDVQPDHLAANILVKGADLSKVRSGDELRIGNARIRVSQIGKFYPPGSPWHKKVLSRFGIFGKVVVGGEVKVDDPVILIVEQRAK